MADAGYSAEPNYDAPPYASPNYEDGAENYYEPVTKPPVRFLLIRPGSGPGPSPNGPGFWVRPVGLTFLLV
jgi:hypothetical protein